MIKVQKRDGQIVDFDITKIENAIAKAFDSSMFPDVPSRQFFHRYSFRSLSVETFRQDASPHLTYHSNSDSPCHF